MNKLMEFIHMNIKDKNKSNGNFSWVFCGDMKKEDNENGSRYM